MTGTIFKMAENKCKGDAFSRFSSSAFFERHNGGTNVTKLQFSRVLGKYQTQMQHCPTCCDRLNNLKPTSVSTIPTMLGDVVPTCCVRLHGALLHGSSFFSFLVFTARALGAWAIKRRKKTRSTTCRRDRANEANKGHKTDATSHNVVACCWGFFGQQCCVRLHGPKRLTGFKLYATSANKCQHCGGSMQTDATCWAQQCCVLLANNVASVCIGLKRYVSSNVLII